MEVIETRIDVASPKFKEYYAHMEALFQDLNEQLDIGALSAPRDGIVKKIKTHMDAKVAPGDILLEIDEEVTQDE